MHVWKYFWRISTFQKYGSDQQWQKSYLLLKIYRINLLWSRENTCLSALNERKREKIIYLSEWVHRPTKWKRLFRTLQNLMNLDNYCDPVPSKWHFSRKFIILLPNVGPEILLSGPVERPKLVKCLSYKPDPWAQITYNPYRYL